ncbi:hypothetical protein BJV74DRAFT_469380 [Russula compacta]|nr:hypothetical protein BJV74DRAFT_469380 [Russula compacta]
MFKILRRISSSIYPRPDRPWSDDATSTAPTIGRKRKMNDEDEDTQGSGSSRKRRGELERQDTSELGELRVGVKGNKGSETDPGVKEVTQGVKEVELEDKKEGGRTDDADGTAQEASKTVDGESNDAAPLDPADAPQNDDGPSQAVTVTDEKKVPAGQSEATDEAPSNDPSEVEAPTSTDVRESLASGEREKEPLDATPEVKLLKSDEGVDDPQESVEPGPES